MKILCLLERMLTVLFWILLMFGFDAPRTALLTLIAAIIHEAGHILAGAVLFGGERMIPKGAFSGFRILRGGMSYKDELILASTGPLTNIVIYILCLPFCRSDTASEFALLNLLTALSNLIPIYGYDGYRMLSCAISLLLPRPSAALRGLWCLSFLLAALFVFISLYIMLILGEGYWLFGVSFGLLLSFILERLKLQNQEK